MRLPQRLRICPTCGEARGWSGNRKSWCPCEGGVVCRHCGIGRIQPNSNYYDLRDGTWWHVPYFGGAGHCRLCESTRDARLTR